MENTNKVEKKYKSFWPMVLVALVSALVGGALVWSLYNQGMEEQINSLMPGMTFKTRHNKQLKACPENWYENKMPSMEKEEKSEYYVYQGKRREISEFDAAYVRDNCKLEKETVY